MAKSKSLNGSLHSAREAKQDEFYTQLTDIEKELKHYTKHFRGKVIYLNCDDPKVSNFYRYFSLKFKELGLKRLIATCYKNEDVTQHSKGASKYAVRLEYNGKEETETRLEGDGDFRSDECIALLKRADIVVTNPPFSLFREYVAQLVGYGKKFLIIGNMNAITYKGIFSLIQANKMWLGCMHPKNFVVPDHYEVREVGSWRDKDGANWRSLGNVCWYTNLDHGRRHEDLILYKTYTPKEYPTYDNYNAIEVSKTKKIPMDYKGAMGVPITFLDKYNPDQFEIVKFRKGDDEKDLAINGKTPYFRIIIRRKK